MDSRHRLLDAAAQVYAQFGYLGATTRRIAEAAGVNEVTLFRHFGSKDALVEEAIRCHAVREAPTALPEVPGDPEQELTEWCRAEIGRLRRSRDLLRQCFAESDEHPELASQAAGGMANAAGELRRYVERLHARRALSEEVDRNAAMAMLLSAMFSDALGRDQLAEVYAVPRQDAPRAYARVFLAALGARGSGLGTRG